MYDEEPQKHRLRGTTPAAGRTDRLGYEDFSWDNPCAWTWRKASKKIKYCAPAISFATHVQFDRLIETNLAEAS